MKIPNEIELNIRRIATFRGSIDIYMNSILQWLKSQDSLTDELMEKLNTIDSPTAANKVISYIESIKKEVNENE